MSIVIWPFSRPRPVLPPALAARCNALALEPVRDQALDGSWVVVDVETGGLDPRADPLLAIGAVRVAGLAIDMVPSCEVYLRQREATATDNILLHGITTGQQLNAQEPAAALLDWLAFAGGQPRLAYHAAFDRMALARASEACLGLKERATWLDLAVLAPLLVKDGPGFDRPLDDWLAHFRIPVYQRHGALSDAYATAQLWLALLPAARAHKLTRLRQLDRFSRQAHWFRSSQS